MGAQWYDANISIPGCDKNMPGCLIAMGALEPARADGLRRHDQAGRRPQGRGARHRLGVPVATASSSPSASTRRQRFDIVRHACPGAGACGGMYTANTMASAIEALGMSLPYSASTPAEDPAKLEECRRAGAAIRRLLELDLKPRDIMTREAFENAMVGGDGARRLDQRRAAPDRDGARGRRPAHDRRLPARRAIASPLLADLKPSGSYVMEDLHRVGGTPAVMKLLLEHGALDGELHDGDGQDARREPRATCRASRRGRRDPCVR